MDDPLQGFHVFFHMDQNSNFAYTTAPCLIMEICIKSYFSAPSLCFRVGYLPEKCLLLLWLVILFAFIFLTFFCNCNIQIDHHCVWEFIDKYLKNMFIKTQYLLLVDLFFYAAISSQWAIQIYPYPSAHPIFGFHSIT